MRNLFFIAFLVLLASGTSKAQSAWRPGEMQVLIPIEQPAIARMESLAISIGINSEQAGNFIRCYLTPSEAEVLERSGITYETEITDLNAWSASFGPRGVPTGYYTVAELNEIADSLAQNFPDICTLHNLGSGTGFNQLLALKISDNSAVDENEAEVLFDGGIHGDEIGGPENLIRFARDLCLGYGTDEVITNLVNNREIWIYYCVNPYGRLNMTRYNQNGVDINRDCGYMWNNEGNSPAAFSQPETKIYRNLLTDNQFVIHCSYHSGTEYISYPWSYRPEPTPDAEIHDYLAILYASNSGYSNIPYGQGYNGMYAINGSTKDFGHGSTGAISWSVEISLSKQPPASQIVSYYLKNKQSMITMADYAGLGIEGIITSASTGEPVAATILINNYFPITNDPVVGDYHKFLKNGVYQVRVEANGYAAQTFSNVSIDQTAATILNVALQPATGHFLQRIIACQIPNNNYSDEGNTPAALGPPDSIRYSLGRFGYAIFDMGESISDEDGNEFIVYENDISPEGYQLLAGQTMDGPWIALGNATGNREFDLAGSNLASARYLKIKDDGDGQSQAADAGFDLDAIEGIVPFVNPDSTGFINGIIYSLNDNLTVPGATVTCGTNIAISDNNGYYIIEADTGRVEICAEQSVSYMFGCDSVNVNPGDTLVHDMYLPVFDGITQLHGDKSAMHLSPNPASDYTILTFQGNLNETGISVFSADGRKIICNVTSTGKNQRILNTSRMKTGLYFVRLQTGIADITQKLIIRQ